MPQPALDPGTQSETVSIRVPKAVKANYKRMAKASGRSLSAWVRDTLDGGVTLRGSVKPADPLSAPVAKQEKAQAKKAHEHEATEFRHHGGAEIPACKCGAIFVNKRWL